LRASVTSTESTFHLSFAFVQSIVLIWGVGRYLRPRPSTPEQRLIDSARPNWLRWLRAILRAVAVAYFVNFLLFVVNTPLLIAEQNMASPVALLVGPVLVLLTSIALVTGFLLFLGALMPGLAETLGVITQLSLGTAEVVVRWADALPGGAVYLAGLPMLWVLGFYLLIALIALLGWPQSKRFAWGLLIWVFIGFVWPVGERPGEGELRVTYLAVGHGGCTVLETVDGRCFLYDSGAVSGPDTVRRVIATYLWHRGIRRVDEVFLSHADADHFNGIPELLRRFPVGRITFTPSFADKPTEEVAEALNAVKKHGIEMRSVAVGQRFEAGAIAFEVLHPPLEGPGNSENERSLVLVVRHAGHTLLFTGDLEKSGTAMLLKQPPIAADAMQAPHHGSQAAFPTSLSSWASPKFVVVNRGGLYANFIRTGQAGENVPIWDTHACGAITLRSHRSGLTAEAFRTKERVVIVRGGK
jgi:competence protein ComEC